MLQSDVPRYWDQATLIAKNPVVAAKFFNVYLRSFLSALLGYDPNQEDTTGGVLGVVKAHYGCIEAQGRGSLHCHMLVWLEGGLNPNEIKRRAIEDPSSEFCTRLVQYLDDAISNIVPPVPDDEILVPSDIKHPCSVRGTTMQGFEHPAMESDLATQKDLHNLVLKCQVHTHTGTCYKYSRSDSHPKECRFGLDASNNEPISYFNPENGELTLRCLDGLVNNFNEYIIRAIRCNMDIKFIGSGASAKAVMYYITNYITKSQLKVHVAYAALERAVKRLDEQDIDDDPLMVRAKRLLQKCAYMMISQQEMSAQQVCTYLLGLDDHFTSHSYQNLYWASMERFVEAQDPSPEC
ncbi:uncharacterized protein C8R40DRAFT_1053578, partial [Lentinula edodes]|uniref:uncharacterized protein n=1 Tax=Lentinula edodes TaxID=5353 RepID=UPI001E8D45AB